MENRQVHFQYTRFDRITKGHIDNDTGLSGIDQCVGADPQAAILGFLANAIDLDAVWIELHPIVIRNAAVFFEDADHLAVIIGLDAEGFQGTPRGGGKKWPAWSHTKRLWPGQMW